MKTADIYTHDLLCAMDCPAECIKHSDLLQWVQVIQLDAMKEGMRRAAQITNRMITGGDCGHEGTSKAIITAAEQLTEANI